MPSLRRSRRNLELNKFIMKKLTFLLLFAVLCFTASAQNQQIYKFKAIKDIPVTPVKDQSQTGTCWCFGTTSFLEAELIRMGKGEYDLSEMYFVRKNYEKRIADDYLRQGKGNLNQGSICHMVPRVVREDGIMPENVYNGLNYGSPKHNHTELNKYIKAVAAASVELKNRSAQYWDIMEAIFDTYLGKLPETFKYEGKEYDAKGFAQSLGFTDMSEYVELTSFSNHPFYQIVPLEIPDNWDHQWIYNVPLEEMMAIINNALENGYTVAWDGDLTRNGSFNHKRGIAINPEPQYWDEAVKLEKKYPELKVTQENRQRDYETFNTKDDHIMHLTGLFKDQDGTFFYKTKNSWGTDSNEIGGYLYMSESYVAMRTISILLHKDAIPAAIRAKMGIR